MVGPTRDNLLSEALKLSVDDRAALAEALWRSLREQVSPTVESAWRDEINRRLDSLERGSAEVIDEETVWREVDEERNW